MYLNNAESVYFESVSEQDVDVQATRLSNKEVVISREQQIRATARAMANDIAIQIKRRYIVFKSIYVYTV